MLTKKQIKDLDKFFGTDNWTQDDVPAMWRVREKADELKAILESKELLDKLIGQNYQRSK